MIRNTFQTTKIDTTRLQFVNSRNLLHHTKFGFYKLQSFFVYCCHTNIDFTYNYINFHKFQSTANY